MIRLVAKGAFSFVDRAQSGQWTLQEGDGGAKEIVVRRVPFVIGRALDCDLQLPHSPELQQTTSRWHCHLTAGKDGCQITDGSLRPLPDTGKLKPSITGTWLDGKKIAVAVALVPGAVLSVGPWRFGVEGLGESQVDIDGLLKTIVAEPSEVMDPAESGVTRAFAQLHELFGRIEKAVDAQEGLLSILTFALAKIDHAIVAAILEEAPDGAVSVRAAWHRDTGQVQDLRFSSALLRSLPADRSIILKSPVGAPTKSQREQRISSGLVVPLRNRAGRMGFLYMDNRNRGGAFTEGNLHLAYALASVASLQFSLERQAFLARVEQNMRQYFGPDVVRLIVKASRDGKPLGLGVRECEATVLFVDLQGFSSFCRERTPREISELLTPYYKLVSQCIQEHGGHVDKFMGDGVMGVFGAQPKFTILSADCNHAVHAARSARQIVAAWAEGSLSSWRIKVSLRAGMDSGSIVAGNIGFAGRMEYSVIGDAVNLASRMEKFARPNAIALSDAARRLVVKEFSCEDGGEQEVHGFGKVRVWHLA